MFAHKALNKQNNMTETLSQTTDKENTLIATSITEGVFGQIFLRNFFIVRH